MQLDSIDVHFSFYHKTNENIFCSNVEIKVFVFFCFLHKLFEKVKKFFNFGRNFDFDSTRTNINIFLSCLQETVFDGSCRNTKSIDQGRTAWVIVAGLLLNTIVYCRLRL